jgi:hypothetical protein
MEYSSDGQRVQVEGSPTAAEKRIIESYVSFRAHLGFDPNKVMLRKRQKDSWCYGLESWPPGTAMIPEPHETPMSLTGLLDWVLALRGQEWAKWKAAHREVFAHRS